MALEHISEIIDRLFTNYDKSIAEQTDISDQFQEIIKVAPVGTRFVGAELRRGKLVGRVVIPARQLRYDEVFLWCPFLGQAGWRPLYLKECRPNIYGKPIE